MEVPGRALKRFETFGEKKKETKMQNHKVINSKMIRDRYETCVRFLISPYHMDAL